MIVWGKYSLTKYLGYVADFCPICRDIRNCRLLQMALINHIYFIPIGRKEIVAYRGICQECGYAINTDLNKYQAVVKSSTNEIPKLSRETFPNLTEYYADRLELEKQLKRDGGAFMPREERINLILEPFLLMERDVGENLLGETKFENLGIKSYISLGLAITFLLFACIFINLTIIFFLLSLGAFIYWLYQVFTYKSRWVEAKIYPKLVRSLKVIRPSKEELSECLKRLSPRMYHISKFVKVERLHTKLTQSPFQPKVL